MTWDEMAVAGTELKDINDVAVRQFLHRARLERRWNVNPETPVQQVLGQLGLIRDGKLTAAGLLLFGRDPQRLMPQATLRCARFKGDTAVDFLDMKMVEGGLIEQVEEALAFVKQHISMAVDITHLERKEQGDHGQAGSRRSGRQGYSCKTRRDEKHWVRAGQLRTWPE